MTEPLVCCILLTKDRPEMAKRAVESFRAQTYQRKLMMILDNADNPADFLGGEYSSVFHWCQGRGRTIGSLRNLALESACQAGLDPEGGPGIADIFIHFDDDDWSHPNRISEQVALLKASGKEAVGYRDSLFWRDGKDSCVCEYPRTNRVIRGAGPPQCMACGYPVTEGEAWLYHNDDPRYCLGSSLCYWRTAWERNPFPNISRGEDQAFLRGVESMGVSSLADWNPMGHVFSKEPRMICSIHSGNHVPYDLSGPSWKRVPEFDARCLATMAL